MAEYIERGRITEIALKLLAAYADAENEYIWETSDRIREDTDKLKKAVEDKRKEILSIPAVDVRPVVRAFWVGEKDGIGICSNCKRLDHNDPLATHCRYCGAEMSEKTGR